MLAVPRVTGVNDRVNRSARLSRGTPRDEKNPETGSGFEVVDLQDASARSRIGAS